MDFFRDLGLAILERWRRADYDSLAFPEIASDALRERPPSAHVDPMDVVRWVHQASVLVPQADIEGSFGQPPVTVFACERFYIDVLFWVDGSPLIHQHRFSGAFHVMRGSSIQSTYAFRAKRRYCENLLAGELQLKDVELLTTGDVRPILAGAELVHALFHLDRPSVSVVVRTTTDTFAGAQYGYVRSGLAFNPFAASESITRKIQTLDLLWKLGDDALEPFARDAIRSGDSFLAFKLLTHLMKRIEPHARFLELLESIRPSHGELLDVLAASATAARREQQIIARRQLVKTPEHRFFLALLLNVPERARILDIVRTRFPDHDPVDKVLRWLGELAKLDEINAWVAEVSSATHEARERRVLDFRFDDASKPLLRRLLEGGADDASSAPSLRESRLLEPLFEGGATRAPD